MYQYKEKYVIDFTNVKTYLEMHFEIRKALGFPDYYGCNWDAFWDLLWSDCDADNVLITGVNTMPDELIEYMSKIYLILDRKVDERKKYGKLYNDIKPFSYRIDN